jgi:hypothetical protein
MIRNFIRQSRPWTNNVSPVIGRWNINRKVDLDKIDNCDDRVCGDLKITIPQENKNKNYSIQSIVEDYNMRWNKNITVEDYLKDFTRKHRGAC